MSNKALLKSTGIVSASGLRSTEQARACVYMT